MNSPTIPDYPDKASAERAAFLAFSERMGQGNEWVSVESRQPPEPDLLCVSTIRGAVAFELVSITDPKIAQVNAGFAKPGETHFYTSDPSERIIRSKLKKTYTSPHRIELLVYTDQLVITPDDVIIPTILPWIDSIEHSFKSVWFMGERETRRLWHDA